MPSVSFRNGNLHYSDHGSGRVLLLLHGFLESSRMWDDYAQELSSGFRVITLDLPGHGTSDCFGYVHSMELMADAVKTVLDHLRIRKAVVVGHSMGGYAALALADRYPDVLKGLCLFFSTARADSEEKKIGRERSIALVQENHRSFIRQAVPLLFRPKNRRIFREQVNALKKEALKTPPQGIVAALQGMKQRPDREVVVRFSPAPVLYVIGKHDPVLPYRDLIEQAEGSKQASYQLLPECGHMGFIEERDACLRILRQFTHRCYRPATPPSPRVQP